MNVDFGRTAADYGRYRAGFPNEFFERLSARGLLSPPCRALDVGTGTGTVARGLALRGCDVTALDRSASLLAEAARLDDERGVKTRYIQGYAETLPFEDASYDLITAGQCWHWFDRAQAAAEAYRVLKTGGHIAIAHFDWIALPGNVVDATERLIAKHNPHWDIAGGTGIHPASLTDIAIAGFKGIESFSFDVDTPYTHEGWRGRIRASAGIAASLPPDRVAEFDSELSRLLATRYSGDPLSIPHRVWAVIARKCSE
jgi:SAM-dependent methyltransferase